MKLRIIILFVAMSFIASSYVSAQMECRSMLGAHLTPFKKDVPILWGVEGTMAPGVMTSPFVDKENTQLNGGMLLGALDIGFLKNNHIYIEGGYKNWKNSEFVDQVDENRHIGVRQAFYSYSGKNTNVKIGLHESRLGDFFLLDERILGASLDKDINAFTINLRAATVLDNFARMGKFCANRHLYGIINPDYTENIGEKPGETNLAGFVINWDPHYVKPKETKASDDEFHENHDFNEFGNSDEFSNESESKPNFTITNVGFIFYDEFGTEEYIPNNKLYTGVLVDMNLPYGLFIQTGSVYQNMFDNNTVVYIAKLGKNINWDNASNTKISGAFIGKYDIDNDATFQPLFSNLFIGEIMRMDAAEFPLWQFAVKHRFPGKLKLHLAAKAVGQIEDVKTNEQDIEVGLLTLKGHLKLTLVGSRVESQAIGLDNEFYMGRLEMRLAF